MSFPAHFQFSQSNLQDYVECARRFELRHLQRLRWPAVETEPIAERERQMKQGAAFHHMVHQHIIGVPAEAIVSAVSDDTLRRWWAAYIQDDFQAQLPARRLAEIALSAPFGQFRLLAKYDLIAVEPGVKAVIVDWKTAQKRPRREDLARRMQTIVYPLLLVLAGAELNDGQPLMPELIEMIYWFADEPHTPERFLYNSAQYAQAEARLTALIDEIVTREQFALTADLHKCRFCVYRSLCQRGVEAGSTDELTHQGSTQDDGFAIDFGFDLDFDQIAEVEY